MKAIVYTNYGPPEVLRIKEVAKPAPTDDEVLIKIQAVSVNRSDWEGLIGKPLYARIGGLLKPRRQVLGSDIAGRVEMVGRNIRRFQPGDEVFGDILGRLGGFAEYVCAREKSLALKPAGMTFEEVAAIPQAAVIALQGIRDKGQVQPGQKVLINGAGGGAGMFAVQLARLYGAEVTGVDNTGKLDFMRSLGAEHVIDYTREDFTKNGKQYDLILDVIAHRSVFAYKRALKPNGSYFAVGGSVFTAFQILLLGSLIRRTAGKKIRFLVVRPNLKDLAFITQLCEIGKVVPVIDRRYPLSGVPEALRYLGDGRVKGKVVIAMEQNNEIQRTEGRLMKAIVCTKYGSPDVLQLQEVEKPAPADDEVLVKIHAASVNAGDWHIMRGKPFLARMLTGGFRKPKYSISGSDIAGRVEAVGKNVTEYKPGDEVFGAKRGAFAEYVCARENALVLKPVNVTFEQAAAVPGAAITALQALRDKGQVRPGQKVLINGASGGVGTFAVQIAKAFGAEVTGVCSTRNLDAARRIGADHVIDYTQEDFTRNGRQYDLIIDIAANHSVSEYKRALAPQGVCVFTGFSTMFHLVRSRLMGSLASRTGTRKFVSFMAKFRREDLDFVKAFLEAGKVVPVIDRRYPLSETAQAVRYFEVEHARGKVIITTEHEDR